jgi:hypothetical protein
MWMGGPLWPPAVALGLGIIALHRWVATRAPTPPNSSPGLKSITPRVIQASLVANAMRPLREIRRPAVFFFSFPLA